MSLVLVVEDNPANMELITTILDEEGYEVITATDGASGLSLAYNRMPDVVLMDVSLPLLNGLDATRILKREAQTRDIPIIALTAHAMRGDKEECLAAGCNDYETKPINGARIMQKMEALMSARAPEFVRLVERTRAEMGSNQPAGSADALEAATDRVAELESLMTKAALESDAEYKRRLAEVEANHAAEMDEAELAAHSAVAAVRAELDAVKARAQGSRPSQNAAEVEKVIDEMIESHNEEVLGMEREHTAAMKGLQERLQSAQAELEAAAAAATAAKRGATKARKLAAEKRLAEARKQQEVLEQANARLQAELTEIRASQAAMPVDTRMLQAEVERHATELSRARSALVALQHSVRAAVDKSFHDAMFGAPSVAEAAK